VVSERKQRDWDGLNDLGDDRKERDGRMGRDVMEKVRDWADDEEEVFNEAMLGRSAAGSSEETEMPCEHCDGQSHFLKHQISSQLYALT
jgi:hypothetical protein